MIRRFTCSSLTLLAVMACLFLPAPPLAAQTAAQEVSIRVLRQNFTAKYRNEAVLVKGWVASERRVTSRSYRGFYLKDRFGDFLLVRTTEPLPGINEELEVVGVALRDADTGDIFLTETSRKVIPTGAEVALEAERQQREQERKDLERKIAEQEVQQQAEQQRMAEEARREADANRQRTYLITGIAIAAVVLVAVALLLMRRRPELVVEHAPTWEPPSPPVGGDTLQEPLSAPMGGGIDDYKTVKVYKTTKVLPGRLVVMENRKESDIIHLTDQSGRGEIEIGRDSPDVTSGIRIKDRSNTLSRRQARLVYSAPSREFKLVNLAGDHSNPTVVNGRQMEDQESVVLKDGDLLTMGSVEMKFRS